MNRHSYDELYKQINFSQKPFGYDADYFSWRTAKLKRELSKFISTNSRILDVGGGTGIMAQFLPDFVSKKNYYNMDISYEMLKYSQYQNILAAAEEIPCPDSSFNYVILSEVLEHVNDKIKVLSECYRVIKLQGLFLLSTPRNGWIDAFKKSPFSPLLIIDMVLNKLCSKKKEFQIPEGVKDEPSDEDWLKETLENIGFRVLKQYRADNHLPWGKSGESRFWRWFADKFVNPSKYGHCTIVICKK